METKRKREEVKKRVFRSRLINRRARRSPAQLLRGQTPRPQKPISRAHAQYTQSSRDVSNYARAQNGYCPILIPSQPIGNGTKNQAIGRATPTHSHYIPNRRTHVNRTRTIGATTEKGEVSDPHIKAKSPLSSQPDRSTTVFWNCTSSV